MNAILDFITPWIIMSVVVFIFKGSDICFMDMFVAAFFYLIWAGIH